MSYRPKQETMRERLTDLAPHVWYTPANPSERTTLAFMRKRGVVQEHLLDGRCVYRLWRPELSLGSFGAEVVDLASGASGGR